MMANPILDKITKLNAEIEQLRAENSHLRRIGVDRIPAEVLALQATALADLRAENERLRTRVAVLEKVRSAALIAVDPCYYDNYVRLDYEAVANLEQALYEAEP